MENEIRFTPCKLSIREASPIGEDSQSNDIFIEGLAIAYNSESVLLRDETTGEIIREVIEPLSDEFIASQDIKYNYLHERALTIGRRNADGTGNMELFNKVDGLYYRVRVAKDSPFAMHAYAMVRDCVFTGNSFEFLPGKTRRDERTNPETGRIEVIYYRETLSNIFALTLGMDPAYIQTSASIRESFFGKKEEEGDNCARESDLQLTAILSRHQFS